MTDEEFKQQVHQLVSNIKLDTSVPWPVIDHIFNQGARHRASSAKSNFNALAHSILSENDVKKIYDHALLLLSILASLGEESLGTKGANHLYNQLKKLVTDYLGSKISEIDILKNKISSLESEIKALKNVIRDLDLKVVIVDINGDKIKELQEFVVPAELQNLHSKLISLEQDMLRYNQLKADIARLEQATSLSLTQELDDGLTVREELTSLKTKIAAIKTKARELDMQKNDSSKLIEQQGQEIITLRNEIGRLQAQITDLQAQNQALSLSEQRLGISNETLQRENDTAKGAERFQIHSAFKAFTFEERLKLIEGELIPVDYRDNFSFSSMTEANLRTVIGALVSGKYIRQVDHNVFYQPEMASIAPLIKLTRGYREYMSTTPPQRRLLEANIVELEAEETASTPETLETRRPGSSSGRKRIIEADEDASPKPKKTKKSTEAPQPTRSPSSRASK